MKYNPDISIVLMTYNCAKWLERTMQNLVALTEKPRIIAVDNSSADRTLDILRRYEPQVQIIALPKNIGAAARNIGVRSATTPFIAFCDDDTWWMDGSLTKLIEYFTAHPKLAVITAKILVGDEKKVDSICEEMSKSPLENTGNLPGHKLLSFMGGASAIRRDVFLEAGGYEPRLFLGGEEELLATDIAVRGYEMRYIPDVVLQHCPSGQSADKLRWYGIRNALWFVWRRRHIDSAWRWTKHIIGTAPKNTVLLKGIAGFLKGLPWVIQTRRPVPDWLEEQLNILDKDRLGSASRDYSGGKD